MKRDELREMVAQAIAKVDGRQFLSSPSWNDFGPEFQDRYREEADAAIAVVVDALGYTKNRPSSPDGAVRWAFRHADEVLAVLPLLDRWAEEHGYDALLRQDWADAIHATHEATRTMLTKLEAKP